MPEPCKYSYQLVFPANDQLRARKVIRRSNYGHVIKFASTKCARMIELESLLEHDLAVLYEFNQDVVVFHEQPFRLELTINGVVRNQFPDFLVFYDNGSVVVEEVKPFEKLSDPDIAGKFAIQKEIYESLGYGFRVVTDRDIRSGLTLQNSKRLLPYRRIAIDHLVRESVRNSIGNHAKTGLELIRYVFGVTEEILLAMVAQGILATDLSQALSLESYFQFNVRRSILTEKQLLVMRRTCV